MGMAGNKGAVVARFNIFDTSVGLLPRDCVLVRMLIVAGCALARQVCLVNAHLAAHQKNVKGLPARCGPRVLTVLIRALHCSDRNSDYHNIIKKCSLLPPTAVAGTASAAFVEGYRLMVSH